jgi:uncharacterized protein DUF6925
MAVIYLHPGTARYREMMATTAVILLLSAAPLRAADTSAASRPTPMWIVSLNMCTDELVLRLADPHRVFQSRIGRIEVYQTIPPAPGKSPDGPHTHVLPKLLRSRRTHPATEPIPDGWVPCAHLYPPHPVRDGLGESQPFDAGRHDTFQRTMEMLGNPESLAIKRRVIDAVNAGELPSAVAQDRHGRISNRIALRQMKAAGHASAALPAWLASFDQASPGSDEDEAALYHNH